MSIKTIDDQTKMVLLKAQKDEITEYNIYLKLSELVKAPHNKSILKQIAHMELEHYNIFKKYTKMDIKPSKWRIRKYILISKIFGLTFGLKLMEKGEEKTSKTYHELSHDLPEVKDIAKEEEEHKHELKLINELEEDRLHYIGSMVLGLNDALVELTGALAGFTFALQSTSLIALVGLITGIAAALSMGASEYLSVKAENGTKTPVKAALYTGGAYLLTVLLLIFPYLIYTNYYLCLAFVLIIAIIIIFVFNYYISIIKEYSFMKRFSEMAILSLGIAALSFIIGILLKMAFVI